MCPNLWGHTFVVAFPVLHMYDPAKSTNASGVVIEEFWGLVYMGNTARVLSFAALIVVAGCPSWGAEDLASPTSDPLSTKASPPEFTGVPFFDDATMGGDIFFFQRKRTRYDVGTGRYENNLDHGTFNVSTDFNSGLIGDVVGVDVGVFFARDLYSNASPDHEMAFFPWSDPWKPNWDATRSRSGFSLYKGYLKFQPGPFRAKVGLFQTSEVTTLGNNWSLMPGTWRGVELGSTFGDLDLGFTVADAYKAPWFKTVNGFRRADGKTDVDYVWSAGARYKASEGVLDGTTLEAAYGESQNFLMNAHVKTAYDTQVGGLPLTFGYQLYMMDDSDATGGPNDLFDGLATQHFVFSKLTMDPWTFRLETTYTSANQARDSHLGYFAYRLVDRYGTSQGAIDPWWDTRSDWNHDKEWAAFAKASRKLDDIGFQGLEVGVSWSQGWGGRALGTTERLGEWALAFDLGFTVPEGPLQGTSLRFHYTDYHNQTNLPSWEPFKNAFQNERDYKFMVHVPVNL